MTIHITPEPEFSYVSFETNMPAASYREIITKVLDTFHPGKFVITVFTNEVSAKCECGSCRLIDRFLDISCNGNAERNAMLAHNWGMETSRHAALLFQKLRSYLCVLFQISKLRVSGRAVYSRS